VAATPTDSHEGRRACVRGTAPVPQRPNFQKTVTPISPAGQVPALEDGDVSVWKTLAILEYFNEKLYYLNGKFPAAELWPADRAAGAHARALAAEMHAGFAPLRRECPMNMWHPPKTHLLSPEAGGCRARFGQQAPFLFGRFSAADAMYAPWSRGLQPT